jgi:hypothetical protein
VVSTLEQAQGELQRRGWRADEVRAPDAALWSSLASVADYLRRLAEVESPFYRAEKSFELVRSAMSAQTEALLLVGGDGLGDDWYELVTELHEAVSKVVLQVGLAMWATAEGHYPFTWRADELRRAMAGLCQHTNRLYERAIPDPDGGPW